jgi:hypothetical protein
LLPKHHLRRRLRCSSLCPPAATCSPGHLSLFMNGNVSLPPSLTSIICLLGHQTHVRPSTGPAPPSFFRAFFHCRSIAVILQASQLGMRRLCCTLCFSHSTAATLKMRLKAFPKSWRFPPICTLRLRLPLQHHIPVALFPLISAALFIRTIRLQMYWSLHLRFKRIIGTSQAPTFLAILP